MEQDEVGLENNEDEGWFMGFNHEGRYVFIQEFEVALEDYMVPMLRRKEAIFL